MDLLKPSMALLAVVAATPEAIANQECGNVTIAEMTWASAGLAAWVDKIILEAGYGCDVELVAGDTVPTFTSMNETGQPDIAPELWVNAVRVPLEAAVEDDRIVIAANILSDGGVEGFWIPTAIAEANGITSIEDALAHPELFPGAEDSSRGAFFNCPSGWACQIITDNQFRALNAGERGFDLVDSGSPAGLDASVARAFSRDEGWLGYYWAPTAVLGRYAMTRLDLGVEHDPDLWESCTIVENCAEPALNEWPHSDVFTVASRDFSEANPVTMDYLGKRAWSNDVVNGLLAWMSDNQATTEEGAHYFLENHPGIWSEWLSEDVATAVKDAL